MPAANYASIKLSSALVEDARREAEILHRSVGAQVEHWAKLGRAIENTPGFDLRKVRSVLEGHSRIEDLTAVEQDRFFDELGAHFDEPNQRVSDYFAELGAREGAVGNDEHGRIVRRTASGRARRA